MLLQQLPNDIEPLRFTVSLFIGKFAPWLASHQEQLQPLLPYLAQGLSIPKCANAAAISIKNLCERIALGHSVLELYNQVCGKLELAVELEILEGLCKGVDESQAASYLPQIVQPIGNRLQELLQKSSPPKHVSNEIDRLTVAVRFLRIQPTTLLEVLQSTWPLLEVTGQKYSNEPMIAEKICRLHKHALRKCGTKVYVPLLPNLMSMVVNFFQSSHQAPYLYLASIIVTEYPQQPELLNMIRALCLTAFGFLSSKEDLTNHPDVVEELFYCMGRMVKYCPEPLANSGELLTTLVQCALVGMELDHRDANRGTLNFIQHLLSYGVENRTSQGTISTLHLNGKDIVNKLVQALKGDLPAHSLDGGSGSISGILFQLHQLMPNEFQQWLTAALQHVPERPANELLSSCRRHTQGDFDLAVRSFKAQMERYRVLTR
jgi:transportin-3